MPSDTFSLVLAMGDPLTICSDLKRALPRDGPDHLAWRRRRRHGRQLLGRPSTTSSSGPPWTISKPWSRLAGRTGLKSRLPDEQFELTTFTPAGMRRLFDANGFETIDVIGKTVDARAGPTAALSNWRTRSSGCCGSKPNSST